MPAITAVRGFKDILPQEIPYYVAIENAARETARRFGYEEIRPPILERTGLFQRGIGESTDIVEKEMYTFEDRNGEKITLRPEATAGVTRAVLEHNLLSLGKTLRLYTIGSMFRYERPQKGRLRQFNQLDVEAFGDKGPYIDAEIISFLITFLNALGPLNPIIKINSLGCPVCRPAYREKLLGFLQGKSSKLCPDCLRRLEQNPLRILDCKNPDCIAEVKDAPRSLDNLCPECQNHFRELTQALSALAIKAEEDPFLVRGLDYYSRTAFEARSEALGAQNAIAGGGRYDGLVSLLGGQDTPGIGFAVGLERLILLLRDLKTLETPAIDYYLAPLSENALTTALKLSQSLRAKGFSVLLDNFPLKLKNHLKKADRLNVRDVVMLGDDELNGNYLTVKSLKSGEQSRRSLEEFL